MKTTLILSLFVVSVAVGAVEIEEVTFGFGDGYKVDTWAPLTITVRNQDGRTAFRGELAVEVRNFSSDTPIERYAMPLHLIGTEAQRKDFYVYCPKNATQLVIQLLPLEPSEETTLRSTTSSPIQDILLPTPFARKDYFVLVLAPSGDKLKRFIDKKQLEASGDAQVHVKYLPNSRSLPNTWIGYSAVDVLVVREARLTDRRILKAQQTAMLDWIQRGGTLIVSGGSSFNYLQGSFIEPFLPVELKGVEKTNTLPTALREQLGFQSFDNGKNLFERMRFTPKAGCETLIGTAEQIYVAKRNFGDGQILAFAFDYNAPPFGVSPKKMEKSEQQVAETFWRKLLSRHGKSPRHLADRYALALQHEEETHKHFLSEMPTRVPLVQLLTIVLPVYLLSFGGFLFYFGRSKQKSRIYWIGGCLFVLLSVSTIASARKILPNAVTADRLSILSVYPERQRAHLLSYVSLRATSRAETSIDFTKGTFIRHQEVEETKGEPLQKIGTLVQDSPVQLRDLSVAPWHPTTFVEEKFLALNTQQLPHTLENTWRVAGKEMIYLGNVVLREESGMETPSTSESSMARLRLQVTPKMPPDEELRGVRETFAQILQRDYVLRYLATEADLNPLPYFIGWTSQSFAGVGVNGNIDTNAETLVIFHPDAGR